MSIYRRVLRYYRPFLPQTLLGLALSLIGIALNLLKPWPFKIIVDQIIPNFRGDARFLHTYGFSSELERFRIRASSLFFVLRLWSSKFSGESLIGSRIISS